MDFTSSQMIHNCYLHVWVGWWKQQVENHRSMTTLGNLDWGSFSAEQIHLASAYKKIEKQCMNIIIFTWICDTFQNNNLLINATFENNSLFKREFLKCLESYLEKVIRSRPHFLRIFCNFMVNSKTLFNSSIGSDDPCEGDLHYIQAWIG